jgi:hypothetical protein
MSPFLDCEVKKKGDSKEINEPEYQVYPDCIISSIINKAIVVFLQIFKEDLYPTSTSHTSSLQRVSKPALSGIHRRCQRYGEDSGDPRTFRSTSFHDLTKIFHSDKIILSPARVQENSEPVPLK